MPCPVLVFHRLPHNPKPNVSLWRTVTLLLSLLSWLGYLSGNIPPTNTYSRRNGKLIRFCHRK
jgi:hypothetical protein